MTDKKKHKAKSFKKMADIERVDEKTFYVKSSNPEQEPYMVFNSQSKGFICDCLSFVYNIEDNGNTRECKHIARVKKEFGLE